MVFITEGFFEVEEKKKLKGTFNFMQIPKYEKLILDIAK